MRPRSIRSSTLAWVLLLGLGCSGLGGGGGGCGCGGCAAIPGGFPADQRQANAITAKLTKSGIDLLKAQVATLVGSSGGSNIVYPLPCTDATQKVGSGFLSVTINIFACDLTGDQVCNAADDSPALRVDEPGHGVTCEAAAAIKSIDVTPTQAADGTVDVSVTLNVRVNTGKIPIDVKAPLCGGFKCSAEFDSDENLPLEVPINVRLKLRVDPAWGDILALDVVGVDDIASAIDSREFHIRSEGGSGCSFGCSVLNVDQVKALMFKQLQGIISKNIKDQFDKFRCRACDLTAATPCPTGSTCNADQNLCYSVYSPSTNPANDKRVCPPAILGTEGRADLGASLAALGGPDSALLDVYAVAGGRNADGTASTRVQSGGIVIGVMGGTNAPERSTCVPPTAWVARPVPLPPDFDAESQTSPTVTDYQLGLGLSDAFLDKTFFDAWAAGLICLNVDQRTTTLLSSGLFGTFIRTLPGLTHGEDVPMLIALRPKNAPNVVIGRGTTKPGPNGTPIPDDPLLTIQMDALSIDFYAFLEERYTRLFSLVSDVRLPLSLEFDPVTNTLTPVLAGLDTLLTNVHAEHIELLSDDPHDLEDVIKQIIGLVQPQIAGALQPIALPAVQGFQVSIEASRGTQPLSGEPGYAHLALFAKLSPAPAQPDTLRVDTEARLVDATRPDVQALRAGAKTTAILQAHGTGLRPRGATFEYAYRADGGLWSMWTTNERLEVALPILSLQGRHELEVRARLVGSPASVDGTPAKVPFVVDYDPPTAAFVLDPETRELRTTAHDSVSAAEALTFRYRVNGADWSETGAAQVFALGALGANPSVEVEVADEAGHVGHALFGAPVETSAAPVPAPLHEAGGCTEVPVAAMALLGLLAARRRR